MFETIKNLSSHFALKDWLKTHVFQRMQDSIAPVRPLETGSGADGSQILTGKGELKASSEGVMLSIGEVINSLKGSMVSYAPEYAITPPSLSILAQASAERGIALISPGRIAELAATFHGEDYAVFRINKIHSTETFAPTFAAEGLAT